MSRTPLHNRISSENKEIERTPLKNKVIREKTPLSNKVIKDKTPLGNVALQSSIDQRLLEVMRNLNLAVAVVAQARDKRFSDPDTMVSPRSVHEAMLHLKEAAQQLDLLRRSLPSG
jgi:hypothetical protein